MRRAARAIAAACAALAIACAVALPGAAAAAERTPTPTPTEEPDPTRAAEYWLDAYGIEDAWDTARGEGVTIAVIDSGVAADIDELDGAVAGGTDVSGVGTADGRTPLGSDVHTRSHGTWVASLAAARGTGDDEGMIGVAPEADVLAVSLGFGSVSDVPFSDQVADAMRWSVDNGADVINLSFTTNQTQWDESWDDAFQYAYDNDVVVVVAAGNRVSGTTMVGAPATIPGVLTVAGVDPDGRASEDASTQGITIGVSAPSEQLLGISPTGTVEQWSGTSGSAPIVSGIAALVRSAYPGLDAVNVINRIVQTADPAPEQTGERDPLYGFGIVDARAAIEDDVPFVSENPMGSLAEWVRINRAAGSEPEVAATPTPDPVELPALPPADGPAEAGSPFLPSAESLRDVTLPLVALSAAGILFVLGVVAVSRRIRSARAQREPNP
ncbi:S8 family serine peptidase [Microbacterium excoecariae]|uniref:S8 family serine peptidase n=1 Tax=Microbacterium excoecariae TaxID=2715210 RepID=UPI0014091C26|nr:S8 family serine peptidase [Microbacterium excoecariae]NHI17350.1 S8 family serine peptidase [Microbacterium excoecariae]